MSRARELADLLDGTDSLAIVCHDNPDPDCLASALALQAIAHQRGVDTTEIVYGGDITHQQNRALVNLLGIELTEVVEVSFPAYERIALVDHSSPGVTGDIPPELPVDVIVDHHPVRTPRDAPFVDVRTEYGTTTTILVEYLAELDVSPTTRLASACLFALHRERLDFVRDPTRREYEAAIAVYPHADLDLLDQLYGTAFTPGTLDAIGRAITDRAVRGSTLVTTVGRTAESDALPQAADYLLNLEGVDTVLVYGIVDRAIRLSARSVDSRVNVGELLEDAFGDVGPVGGHHDMAGGRLPLGLFADVTRDDDEVISLIGARIERRFFDVLHLEVEE